MRITVRAHPRASRNEVQEIGPGQLEVWTTAPPAENRANEAVCRLVADWFGIGVRSVRVVAGAKARQKTLEVNATESP